jgi:glycosyltransferase involved in cell wall biosynthesis
MKKITIIALHLGYGGIEKAICSLANMLCDTYQIEIISTYKLYNKPVFDLNEKVKVTYLLEEKPNKKELLSSIKEVNVFSLIKQIFISARILHLRKYKMIEAIKKIDSDIIISTRIMHNQWLSKYGKKNTIKIAWEHSHHNNNKKYIQKLMTSCSNIDYLIPVSKELTEFYSKIISSRTKCIYIPLALDSIPKKQSLLDEKQIISVGRLSKEKGFLDLIDIFKFVNQQRSDWKLNIVGDGLEKENIEDKIKNEHLENNVIMHGYQKKDKINDLLLNSSIYVMTSFTESFGLVLIEAMSYGIPCICFDSAQGALEIIDNNINGFIISNRDKMVMADKIIQLIDNVELRCDLGKKAKEKANLFNPENIKKEWFKLID